MVAGARPDRAARALESELAADGIMGEALSAAWGKACACGSRRPGPSPSPESVRGRSDGVDLNQQRAGGWQAHLAHGEGGREPGNGGGLCGIGCQKQHNAEILEQIAQARPPSGRRFSTRSGLPGGSARWNSHEISRPRASE